MSQTVANITPHSPVTNGGTVTSFLPLVTGFSSVPSCSTAFIEYYDNTPIAFDPYYGLLVATTLSCLPQGVTLWWNQDSYLTSTALGPLNCPAMYTTASTSIVNSLTTFVACCPISYHFVTTMQPGITGQCGSSVSVGQTLTYASFTMEELSTTQVTSVLVFNSTVIKTVGYTVYGVHINGFIFADATASTTISSSVSAASATLPQLSTLSSMTAPSSKSAPSTLPVSSNTSGLTTAAKIGIGVGTSLAVLGFCSLLLAFILVKRSRRTRWNEGTPMENSALTPELPNTESLRRKPVASQRASTTTTVTQVASPRPPETVWEEDMIERDTSHEVERPREGGVHEMGATLKVPFSDDR